jgi:hypothetical protein
MVYDYRDRIDELTTEIRWNRLAVLRNEIQRDNQTLLLFFVAFSSKITQFTNYSIRYLCARHKLIKNDRGQIEKTEFFPGFSSVINKALHL